MKKTYILFSIFLLVIGFGLFLSPKTSSACYNDIPCGYSGYGYGSNYNYYGNNYGYGSYNSGYSPSYGYGNYIGNNYYQNSNYGNNYGYSTYYGNSYNNNYGYGSNYNNYGGYRSHRGASFYGFCLFGRC